MVTRLRLLADELLEATADPSVANAALETAGDASTTCWALAENADDVGASGHRFVAITVIKSPRIAPADGTRIG